MHRRRVASFTARTQWASALCTRTMIRSQLHCSIFYTSIAATSRYGLFFKKKIQDVFRYGRLTQNGYTDDRLHYALCRPRAQANVSARWFAHIGATDSLQFHVFLVVFHCQNAIRRCILYCEYPQYVIYFRCARNIICQAEHRVDRWHAQHIDAEHRAQNQSSDNEALDCTH